MTIQLPPVFYYLVATALMVFGPLRAYYFGWKHRVPAADEQPKEARLRRRHTIWGVLWFIAGVYIAYLGVRMQRQP